MIQWRRTGASGGIRKMTGRGGDPQAGQKGPPLAVRPPAGQAAGPASQWIFAENRGRDWSMAGGMVGEAVGSWIFSSNPDQDDSEGGVILPALQERCKVACQARMPSAPAKRH